jgi:aminoglycoside phosphotransferase (APT) family kinase protein
VETEVPLEGGNITEGLVRVGDTVRRPQSAASPFVRELLVALAQAAFPGAPRYLGVDEEGRDILDYLEGDSYPKWRDYEPAQVAAGGRLLRAYHEATKQMASRYGSEVILHGDAGPQNCIFKNGLPYALIDFDLAAPGDAIKDVSYAAWGWCISSDAQRNPVEVQAKLLRVFADAYGLEERERLVDGMLERHDWSIAWWQERIARGLLPRVERIEEILAWNRAESAHVERHRELFLAALA